MYPLGICLVVFASESVYKNTQNKLQYAKNRWNAATDLFGRHELMGRCNFMRILSGFERFLLLGALLIEVPETVVSQHKHISGTMPTPPQAPPADVPILVATGKPAATAPATKLPKIGSNLPLVGLLGLLLISTSLGIRLLRTILGV